VETGTVLDGKHVSYRTYVVGEGQNMADVSRKFHVVRISSFNAISQATDLQSLTLFAFEFKQVTSEASSMLSNQVPSNIYKSYLYYIQLTVGESGNRPKVLNDTSI